MIPRKTLGDFLNSNWALYGVDRTGVLFPNCVTYATARISEILGFYQPLDEPNRIVGAGQLIEQHSKEFYYSSTPLPGALMIWGSNVYNQYGHVGVCEDVIDSGTVSWSQSNYGGPIFEFETGNPYTYYPWMPFRGYLIHEDLLKINYESEDGFVRFTFSIDGKKNYYFDGFNVREIKNNDEFTVLKNVYRMCNDKELPHVDWCSVAPWYLRLMQVTQRDPISFEDL